MKADTLLYDTAGCEKSTADLSVIRPQNNSPFLRHFVLLDTHFFLL